MHKSNFADFVDDFSHVFFLYELVTGPVIEYMLTFIVEGHELAKGEITR